MRNIHLQATSGSIRFLAGQEVATFNLQILDDLDPEEDEAVFVRLTGVYLLDAAQIRAGEVEICPTTIVIVTSSLLFPDLRY